MCRVGSYFALCPTAFCAERAREMRLRDKSKAQKKMPLNPLQVSLSMTRLRDSTVDSEAKGSYCQCDGEEIAQGKYLCGLRHSSAPAGI